MTEILSENIYLLSSRGEFATEGKSCLCFLFFFFYHLHPTIYTLVIERSFTPQGLYISLRSNVNIPSICYILNHQYLHVLSITNSLCVRESEHMPLFSPATN